MTARESRPGSVPEEAVQLYGLPLEDFTKARNELAKQLRAEGDPEKAAVVSKLPKPKLWAWALDQVAREDPAAVRALLATAERLEAGGGRERLRQAMAERQDLVRVLTEEAAEVLKRSGHPASANTLEEITRTLYAATDPDDRAALEAGVLATPIEASGFGFTIADRGSDEVSEPEDGADDVARRRELARLDRELKKARQAARRAASEAEEAREAVRVAEQRADAADERAQDAARALGELETKLEELT